MSPNTFMSALLSNTITVVVLGEGVVSPLEGVRPVDEVEVKVVQPEVGQRGPAPIREGY